MLGTIPPTPFVVVGHSVGMATRWNHDGVRPTLVIVDDHEGFRRSARAFLDEEGFDVVGEAADRAQALALVCDLHPLLVLVDVQLPGDDGLAVAEELTRLPEPPMVVLISSRDASAYGARLGRSPARGFVSKSARSREALVALIG